MNDQTSRECEQASFWSRHWLGTAIFGSGVVIWLALGILPRELWPPDGPPWLGNSYEATNALIAALAFGGIIYTIILQSRELALQRQELEETRAELARSADAQQRTDNVLHLSAYLNVVTALIAANEGPMKGEANSEFRPVRMETEYLRCILRAAHLKLAKMVTGDVLASDARGIIGPLLVSRGQTLAQAISAWRDDRRDDCVRDALVRTGSYLDWLARVSLRDADAGGPISQELIARARQLAALAGAEFSDTTYAEALELADRLVSYGQSISSPE